MEGNLNVDSPLTLLSETMGAAVIDSSKKAQVSYLANSSPSTPTGISKLPKPIKLLSDGLRVSTPPAHRVSRRLQLVPDENNPPSPPCSIITRCRSKAPLEDLDSNSQDSGCAMSCSSDDSSGFRFVEPSGFAPKRLNSMESPRRCLQFQSFNSNSSENSNSCDEGCFFEISSLNECADENAGLPSGIDSLLKGRILSPRKENIKIETPKRKSSFFPKSISMREDMKRPLSDSSQYELSPQKLRTKRLKAVESNEKGTLFEYGFWKYATPETNKIDLEERQKSEKDLTIKMALQRSTQEDLIGNFSKPFLLPLTPGKHQDLKSISCETLADLINGKFTESVASYKIIDCRYPYEYDGGHIRGAVNLYTCDHISKELLKSKERLKETTPNKKREILIFHCEFSSERGPFLSRFLRKEDRAGNEYPNLHYPEMYILHGGYSEFFSKHKELCEPEAYKTMQDPAHQLEFKHFKAKSKSWAPMGHKKQTMRSLASPDVNNPPRIKKINASVTNANVPTRVAIDVT